MPTNNSWNNQIAGSFNQIILNAGTNGVAISTDASAATVNVATGAAVKTSTFGSTNSTSATTVQSGSGALNVTSTNGALTINSGTGALGISTDASATTVSFATGAAVKTVTLGSTNTTSSTAIKSGTGNIALNSGLTVDSTGRTLNSVQPAFEAYLNTSVTSVTGDGTAYTVIFGSTRFDQGSNYNTGTGVFTAPVTGKYIFGCSVNAYNFAVGHTAQFFNLVTNTDNFQINIINPGVCFASVGQGTFGGTVFATMTAGNTAYVTYQVNGSTKTVNIYGRASSGFAPGTYFYGYLVC